MPSPILWSHLLKMSWVNTSLLTGYRYNTAIIRAATKVTANIAKANISSLWLFNMGWYENYSSVCSVTVSPSLSRLLLHGGRKRYKMQSSKNTFNLCQRIFRQTPFSGSSQFTKPEVVYTSKPGAKWYNASPKVAIFDISRTVNRRYWDFTDETPKT